MDGTGIEKKIIVYITHIKVKHNVVLVNFHMGTLYHVICNAFVTSSFGGRRCLKIGTHKKLKDTMRGMGVYGH